MQGVKADHYDWQEETVQLTITADDIGEPVMTIQQVIVLETPTQT